MVQQMAIYEQGSKLMVSVPPHLQMKELTFLDRTQVRTYSAFDDRSLTRDLDS